ncbi:MAG: hypothetical protein ACRD5D_05120 [Candidatus Polarisedimenticolia bacterium]
MPRITKDCFGTVIASLRKMKECIRCELLQECRAINWQESDAGAASVVRRPPGQGSEGESADSAGKRPGS